MPHFVYGAITRYGAPFQESSTMQDMFHTDSYRKSSGSSYYPDTLLGLYPSRYYPHHESLDSY